jgi:hypothetical protein
MRQPAFLKLNSVQNCVKIIFVRFFVYLQGGNGRGKGQELENQLAK